MLMLMSYLKAKMFLVVLDFDDSTNVWHRICFIIIVKYIKECLGTPEIKKERTVLSIYGEHFPLVTSKVVQLTQLQYAISLSYYYLGEPAACYNLYT